MATCKQWLDRLLPNMSCNTCGGTQNPNLDTCHNPCAVSAVNTPECETLPSQIDNFTIQFFGEVVKTEVNGAVAWVLPCNLDVGLDNNPRLVGEGLACYFLRLFQDGIIGLTGPDGPAGADGDDGLNAFTVTLASFVQPTLGSPVVNVVTVPNAAILEGLNVFIQNSGWYSVSAADGLGNLVLTLLKPLDTAPGTITAGKLVVPSGFAGASVTGPQGPVGPQGPAGTAGSAWTETNEQIFFPGGTDYSLTNTYLQINFGSFMQVLLPEAGTYLVTAQVSLKGLAGVVSTDVATFRFRNSTDSTTLDGSEQVTSHIVVDEVRLMTISVITPIAGVNKTVRLQGFCTNNDAIQVTAASTTFSYIRIA